MLAVAGIEHETMQDLGAKAVVARFIRVSFLSLSDCYGHPYCLPSSEKLAVVCLVPRQ